MGGTSTTVVAAPGADTSAATAAVKAGRLSKGLTTKGLSKGIVNETTGNLSSLVSTAPLATNLAAVGVASAASMLTVAPSAVIYPSIDAIIENNINVDSYHRRAENETDTETEAATQYLQQQHEQQQQRQQRLQEQQQQQHALLELSKAAVTASLAEAETPLVITARNIDTSQNNVDADVDAAASSERAEHDPLLLSRVLERGSESQTEGDCWDVHSLLPSRLRDLSRPSTALPAASTAAVVSVRADVETLHANDAADADHMNGDDNDADEDGDDEDGSDEIDELVSDFLSFQHDFSLGTLSFDADSAGSNDSDGINVDTNVFNAITTDDAKSDPKYHVGRLYGSIDDECELEPVFEHDHERERERDAEHGAEQVHEREPELEPEPMPEHDQQQHEQASEPRSALDPERVETVTVVAEAATEIDVHAGFEAAIASGVIGDDENDNVLVSAGAHDIEHESDCELELSFDARALAEALTQNNQSSSTRDANNITTTNDSSISTINSVSFSSYVDDAPASLRATSISNTDRNSRNSSQSYTSFASASSIASQNVRGGKVARGRPAGPSVTATESASFRAALFTTVTPGIGAISCAAVPGKLATIKRAENKSASANATAPNTNDGASHIHSHGFTAASAAMTGVSLTGSGVTSSRHSGSSAGTNAVNGSGVRQRGRAPLGSLKGAPQLQDSTSLSSQLQSPSHSLPHLHSQQLQQQQQQQHQRLHSPLQQQQQQRQQLQQQPQQQQSFLQFELRSHSLSLQPGPNTSTAVPAQSQLPLRGSQSAPVDSQSLLQLPPVRGVSSNASNSSSNVSSNSGSSHKWRN